jgi:hypothetical protein
MRELPWSMNVGGEQQSIDVQRMRDNLNASMAALASAIPQLATQGQDPSKLVTDIAEVIKERQRGTQIEDAVKKVFTPEPPAPQVTPGGSPMAPVEQTVPQAPAATPGVPPMEATGQPQAAPDIATLLSQLQGQ